MVNISEGLFTSSNRKKEILIMVEPLKCPKCNGFTVWKYGSYRTNKGKKQKYKCIACGHIWREK